MACNKKNKKRKRKNTKRIIIGSKMEMISNNNKDEEEYRFTPTKVLIYCIIVGLISAILSIFIDGLRLLSMAAFVFASITVWYMFGEKFHKWQERKKEQKHV